MNLYTTFFKRFFDFVFSFLGLCLLLPILIILTLILFIDNRGNPFFIQIRPGKNEKIFKAIKFKTMNEKRYANGELLPDSERLTTIGILLRKTSLDELPQLINVLIGDMSFIGPRPLLVKYLPFYTNKERLRHAVRPGITGWAQVNGRNNLDWNSRLALDVHYINNLSFAFDLKILLKTFSSVLLSKNIVVDPESTMKNLDDERRL